MTRASSPCPAKPDAPCEASAEWGGRRGEGDAPLPISEYKPLPPGEPSRIKAAWGPILARHNVPQGHVPYAEWSRLVDDACRTHGSTLAQPTDLTERLQRPHPPPATQADPSEALRAGLPFPHAMAEGTQEPTVETLLRYQEAFYADRYQDPTFVVDRATLHLPQDRVDGILAAISRREVDYPLVVATPRTLTDAVGVTPRGRPSSGRGQRPAPTGAGDPPPTLHRFLVDTLLRQQQILLWQRSNPDLDTFLEQVRDLTLADVTRTDLPGDGGTPLAFTEDGWLRYLQALYPTLPRPTVTSGYTDIGFVAWERDPPASRVIPDVQLPDGAVVTIQGRSQIDAVAFRYPLITPSRHLALFAQYLAATGEHLDTATWSWTFGIIDPKQFPVRPGVNANWNAGGLCLGRGDSAYANSSSRLRCSR